MFTEGEITIIRTGLPMFLNFQKVSSLKAKLQALQTEKSVAVEKAVEGVNGAFDAQIVELKNQINEAETALTSELNK